MISTARDALTARTPSRAQFTLNRKRTLKTVDFSC